MERKQQEWGKGKEKGKAEAGWGGREGKRLEEGGLPPPDTYYKSWRLRRPLVSVQCMVVREVRIVYVAVCKECCLPLMLAGLVGRSVYSTVCLYQMTTSASSLSYCSLVALRPASAVCLSPPNAHLHDGIPSGLCGGVHRETEIPPYAPVAPPGFCNGEK